MHSPIPNCKVSSKTLRTWKWLWWLFSLRHIFLSPSPLLLGIGVPKNTASLFIFLIQLSSSECIILLIVSPFFTKPTHCPPRGHAELIKSLSSPFTQRWKRTPKFISVKGLSFIAWTAVPKWLPLRDGWFFLTPKISCMLKWIFLLLCPLNFHLSHIIQPKYFLKEGFPAPTLHPHPSSLPCHMPCHDMWHVPLLQSTHRSIYLEITWLINDSPPTLDSPGAISIFAHSCTLVPLPGLSTS